MSTRTSRFVLGALCVSALLGSSLPGFAEVDLPDGPGKAIAQSACAGCHELSRITRAGYSERDWRTVLRMM